MADDVTANPGAGGAIFATDQEAGGRHYPWTKLVWGIDDTFNKVDDATGKRLPVKIGDPLPTGTNLIGSVVPVPATSGGLSKSHTISLATTNAIIIKASPGQIYLVRVFNNAAYPIYVKFHDTAGVPTAGVGVVETIGVQAGQPVVVPIEVGDAFVTGIGMTIVQGIVDTDATAVGLNDAAVDVFYK